MSESSSCDRENYIDQAFDMSKVEVDPRGYVNIDKYESLDVRKWLRSDEGMRFSHICCVLIPGLVVDVDKDVYIHPTIFIKATMSLNIDTELVILGKIAEDFGNQASTKKYLVEDHSDSDLEIDNDGIIEVPGLKTKVMRLEDMFGMRSNDEIPVVIAGKRRSIPDNSSALVTKLSTMIDDEDDSSSDREELPRKIEHYLDSSSDSEETDYCKTHPCCASYSVTNEEITGIKRDAADTKNTIDELTTRLKKLEKLVSKRPLKEVRVSLYKNVVSDTYNFRMVIDRDTEDTQDNYIRTEIYEGSVDFFCSVVETFLSSQIGVGNVCISSTRKRTVLDFYSYRYMVDYIENIIFDAIEGSLD